MITKTGCGWALIQIHSLLAAKAQSYSLHLPSSRRQFNQVNMLYQSHTGGMCMLQHLRMVAPTSPLAV